ncbi:MAG: cyclin [archaeon]|nr:cyclin [archaeon]
MGANFFRRSIFMKRRNKSIDDKYAIHKEEYERKQKALIGRLIQDSKKDNENPTREVNIFANLIQNKALIEKYGAEHYEFTNKLDKAEEFQILSIENKMTEKERIKLIDSCFSTYTLYPSSPKSFFTCVQILDTFLFKTERKVLNEKELKVLGLTCVFMASKLEDPHPLQLCHLTKLTHDEFQTEAFRLMEVEIVKTLDFDIVFGDIEDYIRSFLLDLCLTKKARIAELQAKEAILLLEKMSIGLARLMYCWGIFSSYPLNLRAVTCIVLGFDLLRSNLKKEYSKEREKFIDGWIHFIIEGSKIPMKKVEKLYLIFSKKYQNHEEWKDLAPKIMGSINNIQ